MTDADVDMVFAKAFACLLYTVAVLVMGAGIIHVAEYIRSFRKDK